MNSRDSERQKRDDAQHLGNRVWFYVFEAIFVAILSWTPPLGQSTPLDKWQAGVSCRLWQRLWGVEVDLIGVIAITELMLMRLVWSIL